MQKDNVVSLILIVVSTVLILSWGLIAELLGGLQKPNVPSIILVLILVAAVFLFLGIKKSTLDFKGKILIALIMFFSGIIGPMYLLEGINEYPVILGVVLTVSFIICFVYIISQIADLSFKDKISGIGDKSKFFCIGIIVVFLAFVFLGNMASDHIDYAVGHVKLEKDDVTVVEGSIENGEWVYAGSNNPTGEKGFRVEYPSLKPKLKFNMNDVEWDSELKYDVDNLRDKLNSSHLTAKIRLFNADGEVEHTYETNAKINGYEVIVDSEVGGDSKAYHENDPHPKIDLNYSDVAYATLELNSKHLGSHKNGDENFGIVIISNRFKI